MNMCQDYTVQIVLMGSLIVGITAGILGCFAFLRKQSLLADAISHACLPGIMIMFLITQHKSPYVLLFGGSLAAILGALCVSAITSMTIVKKDAALGIILSVFFGFGLVLLTLIQKNHLAHQSVLNKFLFGNASTLLPDDIICMALVSVIVLVSVVLFWKEFKLLSFDPDYAVSLGYSVHKLDVLLTLLLVLSMVIGLQTVGVVLMSTLFVAPAAAARQWTSRLSSMIFLAAFFGACSALCGAYISSAFDHVPTGPSIVVVMSIIVFISLIIAPQRGIVWCYYAKRR